MERNDRTGSFILISWNKCECDIKNFIEKLKRRKLKNSK
jgi:hypothetical protein